LKGKGKGKNKCKSKAKGNIRSDFCVSWEGGKNIKGDEYGFRTDIKTPAIYIQNKTLVPLQLYIATANINGREEALILDIRFIQYRVSQFQINQSNIPY
jgi:hypothetical protein